MFADGDWKHDVKVERESFFTRSSVLISHSLEAEAILLHRNDLFSALRRSELVWGNPGVHPLH